MKVQQMRRKTSDNIIYYNDMTLTTTLKGHERPCQYSIKGGNKALNAIPKLLNQHNQLLHPRRTPGNQIQHPTTD
jgi:hypothetical protein